MKKLFLMTSFLAVTAMLLCGCKVDTRYDLSNIDTEVTLFKGTVFPFDDLKPIVLGDLVDLDGSEYIVTDENGDYRLRFRSETIEFCAAVPADGKFDLSSLTGELVYDILLDEIPESLRSEDQVIELHGLDVGISIDSGIPFDFTVDAAVEASRNGTVSRRYSFEGLLVHPGQTEFVFNESGSGSVSDVVYQAVPDLGKLMSPLPDQLKINDLIVQAAEGQDLSSLVGNPCGATCRFSVDGPLAFSADSKVRWTVPLQDVELNLDEIGLKKAELTMDVHNTIPLDFSISAVALDAQGNPDSSVTASIDKTISAGRTSSPAVTQVKVTLTSAVDLRFHGLELTLDAASNAEVAGIPLNAGQGLEFKKIVLTLPDGITVDIKK